MDKQRYISLVEKHFAKSEYITIGHKSFKMLWNPKTDNFNAKLFCFIVNSEKASFELFSALCSYAKSVAFYGEVQNKSKICVAPLFITDSTSSAPFEKGEKIGGVYVLPAQFNLENEQLKIAENFPLLSSTVFKQLHDFLKKNFKAN